MSITVGVRYFENFNLGEYCYVNGILFNYTEEIELSIG